MTDKITGPRTLDCKEKCEIPDGLVLAPIPTPRHAWGDTMICPWCGQAFLILEDRTEEVKQRG